jgi:hypothetical protein
VRDEERLKDPARAFPPPQIDATTPNVARVWNYLNGGRDNFDADRKAARQMIRVSPAAEHIAHASRAFVARAVRYLAGEAGIRQFIDIAPGIPAPGGVHEMAQSIAPTSRVLCVDSDPVVLSHARALLRPSPEGATSYLDAGVQEPGKIVAAARAILDLREPTAVVLNHGLNYVGRDTEVRSILDTMLDAMCPGSYLVLVQAASDVDRSFVDAARRWNKTVAIPQVALRAKPEIAIWLGGLEIVAPGIVPVTEWRPEPSDGAYGTAIPLYAAVARKPAA